MCVCLCVRVRVKNEGEHKVITVGASNGDGVQ